MMLVSTDPVTGKAFAERPTLDEAALERALTLSAEAFAKWRHEGFDARGAVLYEAARLLDADCQRLAALMSREMGKPFREAEGEVKKCAWVCRHYAEHGEGLMADTPIQSDAIRSFVRYQPLGAVLGIMPWNFPLWQVFRFSAPALMAGNVVLVKHAPNVGQCAAVIEEIWRRAGAPRGAYQDLPIAVERVEAVIADGRVAAVTLTGSGRAGKAVAAIAGKHLKPTVLELGGSDPFIVMPSADLGAAVAAAVQSRTLNNGQSCIAAKRIILHREIADEFQRRFVEAISALVIGDPMNEAVSIGPLASAAIRDNLARQVDETVEAGANVVVGGKIPKGPGFFYPPTVLTDIPPGTPALTEELFGPVACLFVVDDLDQAIAMGNDTPFGLGASIWTTEESERRAAVRHLEAGAVFVNGLVKSDPRLPFGGIKASGYGRELGRDGMLAFCNTKTIWIG